MKERRAFFRVDADVPIFIRIPAEDKANSCVCALSSERFSDEIKRPLIQRINISGAGICFHSERQYLAGDILDVLIMLESVYPGIITLCTRVLRAEKLRKKYRIAVEYVGLTEEIRELIAKFVFKQERSLRQEKRVGWL